MRLPPELYLCRSLAVLVCLLPATSMLMLQFVLLAGIILSMTIIPVVCTRGMGDVEAHVKAIPFDVIKWGCSLALLAMAAVDISRNPLNLVQGGFVLLASCGMMVHTSIRRIVVASMAGVGAVAGRLYFGLKPQHAAILLLSSAVFVVMTMMWRRLDSVHAQMPVETSP